MMTRKANGGCRLSWQQSKPNQTQKLPLMFYTTHKSLDFMENNSSILRAGMRGWQSKYPERWSFDGDDTCALIFDNPLLADFKNTYNSLPVPVMKADMWRPRQDLPGRWDGGLTLILFLCARFPIHLIEISCMSLLEKQRFPYVQYDVLRTCPQLDTPARSKNDLRKSPNYRTSEEYHRNLGEHYIHFVTGPALFTDMLADAARLKHPEVLLQNDKTKWESVAGVFTTHIPDHDSDDILRSLKKAHPKIRHRDTKFLFNSVGHLYGGTLADGWLIEEQKKRKNYH